MARIEAALDHVLDTVFAENEMGFESESQRLGFYFETKKRSRRRTGRRRQCMFPGCIAESIKRSHTLPLSGPLGAVAEDGHVVAPRFSESTSSIVMEKVGVGEASVFPGFCRKHELEFATFEQAKEITLERDLLLQFYRIVCRELHLRRHDRDRISQSIKAHEKLLSTRGVQLFRDFLGDAFIRLHNLDPKGMSFDKVPRMQSVRRHHENLRQLCDDYEESFFKPLQEAIVTGDSKSLSFTTLIIPKQLPVCLAGRGNFRVESGDGQREIIAWLQVWPTQTETHLAMMGRLCDHEPIQAYLHSFSQKGLGFLAMVESWMVHGTDHWYFQRSAWESIPSSRQSAILNDLMDASRNIGFEYEWSIFDALRSEAIAMARADELMTPGQRDHYIATQEAKLSTEITLTEHGIPLP